MNEFDFKAFISNRFNIDCEWYHKNSYWFAEILCARFPALMLVYLPDEDRFVAVDESEKLYYDYRGIHSLDDVKYRYFKLIMVEDPKEYKQLMDRFMV